MNWYLAKMIYRIISGSGDHKPQFDEQLRLISAASKKEAFQKAVSTGRQHSFSFVNQKQQTVKWQFIDIAELNKLPALTDGMEIYSHLSEADNAGSFMEITHKKADQIRSSAEELATELI